MASRHPDRITVGRICGLFGVKGWVKVFSYTEPRENICRYSPWHLLGAQGDRSIEVSDGRLQGQAVVVKLEGVDDRDAAGALQGLDIEVDWAQLNALPPGEYYWEQLCGLEVFDTRGRPLGRIDHLLRTGAHDVLVVEGERQRLIPFVQGAIVKRIDLDPGTMLVEWAPEY
jgi:16S rRNA processing protein RimM